jgi:transcriptional regulator with XRE-family HTH domain
MHLVVQSKSNPFSPARLLERRRGQGLSQAQLAQMLGISQGHYSKIERGVLGLSPKLSMRLRQVITTKKADLHRSGDQLEVATLEALRGSLQFRNLVCAALELHKKA